MNNIIRFHQDKKHIIIAGTPRAGKTTLARMVLDTNKNDGYIHYKMDAIKRAVFDLFCEERKGDWYYASNVVANLIQKIVEDNDRESRRKDFFIFDTPHVYPDTLQNFDKNQFLIIFLGYMDCIPMEKVDEIRHHDCDSCWTKRLSEVELLRQVEESIEYSRDIKEQCNKQGFVYFDVSHDMMEVLKSANDYIFHHI